MPDPISSACVPQDLVCHTDGDPQLGCDAVASPPAAPLPAAAPACSSALPADSAATPASSALAQKFFSSGSAALPAKAWDQINVQLGLPRLEGHATLLGVHLTGDVDIYNFGAHVGSQNEDGSQGENAGISLTESGVEVTAEYRGWSFTAGISASLGGSISSGQGRDIDGDGVPERCFKMSLGPFTLGECDEL